MSNETSIKNHRPDGGPPVAVYLELVEVVADCGARIAYSERLENLDLVAKKLKEDNA
jgi:hypothetical protein